jgi:C-terminal processing protease CtpA/Prc
LGILISADVKTRLNHRIRDIETGSPGSRSGLRKNDRITHINGINVENTEFGDVLLLIKQGLTTNNNLQLSVIHESTIV